MIAGMQYRSTARRLSGVVAFAALAGVLVSPGAGAAASTLVPHSSSALTAGFPAGWTVLDHDVPLTSQSNTIMYASNQAIHFRCVTTQVAGGSSTECQGPLARLHHNSALVQWDLVGNPVPDQSEALGRGRPLTIDGLPARMTITPGGPCLAALHALGLNAFDEKQEAVGSQETISATVATPEPANYLTFNACMRGPDFKGLTRTLVASLQSTKVLLRPPT
jgi:hypothetical protein